jgi:DNA-binding transcriptional LysR family regulator
MHLQGLDLNLLIALDAVLSEKNVTRAAERIHISQPGMSLALQKLRQYFDDPLLERIGRKMELTNRAQALADPVKRILRQISELSGDSRSFDPLQANRVFRFSATTYSSELLATPLLRKLRTAAPNISVHFEDLSTDTVRRISDGEIDFAITITARMIDDFESLDRFLQSKKLFLDEFVVAMASSNRHQGDTISSDQLCEMPYVETRFGGSFEGISEQVWRQQPQRPRIYGWFPNFQLTLDAVAETDMFTILPSLVVSLKGRSANIRTLPVPFDMPILDERLFWHNRNDNDPGHKWMAQLVQDVIGELMI